MKLTVLQVMNITEAVTAIINRQAPMPQKGKYRMARLHAKLLPEYNIANEQRQRITREYDTLETQKSVEPDGSVIELPTDRYIIPKDKEAEANEKWRAIISQEIEVDVQPIPFSQLDLGDNVDGGVHAAELATLGDLVVDDESPYAEVLPPEKRLNIN